MLIELNCRQVTRTLEGGLQMVITRNEIESGNVFSSLRSLLPLIDNKESVLTHAAGLTMVIRGFEDDDRLLCENHPLRSWMTALTEQFPYWVHFCPEAELVFMLSLLTPVQVARRISTSSVLVKYNSLATERMIAQMVGQTIQLYEEVDFTPLEIEQQLIRLECGLAIPCFSAELWPFE